MAYYTGTIQAEATVVGGRAGYELNIGGAKIFLETPDWIRAGFRESDEHGNSDPVEVQPESDYIPPLSELEAAAANPQPEPVPAEVKAAAEDAFAGTKQPAKTTAKEV